MLVRNAMHTGTVTVDVQDSPLQVISKMQALGVRRLLVVSDGELVGLISDGQMVRALPPSGDQQTPWDYLCQVNSLRLGEIMRHEVFTARPDDDLRQAIGVMLKRHVGGLPVLGPEGALAGILTITDVLRVVAALTFGRVLSDWNTSGWDAADWGTVRQHMSGEAVTVSPDLPLADAAAQLVITRLQVLPVIRDRTLLGLLHQRDIQAAVNDAQVAHGMAMHGPNVVENRLFLQGKTVRDLMCPPGTEVLADAPLAEAVQSMLAADVHGLPVVDGDQHGFLGVITVSDILRALLNSSAEHRSRRDLNPV